METEENILNSKSDILNLTRRLQLEEILHEKEFNESIVYNKSNKQFKTNDLHLGHIVKEIENTETEYKSFTSNISNEDQTALKNLMNKPDIIGGDLVLIDKSYYRDSLVIKGHLVSTVYRKVPLDSDKKVFQNLKSLVEKYKSNLTKREVNYLTNFKWQSSNIYCTPKVHKCKTIQEAIALSTDDYIEVFQPEDLKARPIISSPENPPQRLNCLIENLLKPIVPCLTTYVKDGWEFL